MQRELHGFGQVDCRTSGSLGDLLAATEPVGDNQCVRLGQPDSRQQHSFTYRLGHGKFILLETEGSGHSTASGVERFQMGSHLPQKRFLMIHFHKCFVVAMAMKEHFLRKLRKSKSGRVQFKKFAEEKGLAPQALGARVAGKKVCQLVAKNRGATRLKHHNRQPRIDLSPKNVQDTPQVFFGSIEHAEVVQRPPAA